MTRHKNSDPLQFKSDERQLWAAVILQQIEDATSFAFAGETNKLKADVIRQEARDWLTIPNADFDDACFLAGLDPEWVRNGAIKKIEQRDQNLSNTPGPARRKQLYTAFGKTHSLKEWAASTGINAVTIRNRLNRGISIEDAVSKSVSELRSERTATYTAFDETHSLDQWVEIVGISRRTIDSRIAAGMPIEEALSKPVQIKKRSAAGNSKATPFGFGFGRAVSA